jgi:lysophospholipase L1-like esterase
MKDSVRLLFVFLCALGLLTGCGLVKSSPNIAFLGDSITQQWDYPTNNFGIFGNTTEQMLARLPPILTSRHYKEVVILGGTNDVLLQISPAETLHNLEAIANQAVASGAQPVLCEIPPIFHSFNPNDKRDYSRAVRNLNEQIVQLAARHRWGLLDYYDPMIGRPGFSSDGVHLKRRGYAVMDLVFLRHEALIQ